MEDRKKKETRPWAKDFVLMPREIHDDLTICQLETKQQLEILRNKKHGIKRATLK
jgi:tRNA U34 2-thiouridine synthase MnmA/TrmU